METVSDFIFLGSKITADGDCSHEIKRHLLLGNREGNGNPLQYSYLENPMDGGAWWAAVHGVTRNQTRLSNFTLIFHFHALEKEMETHSSVLAPSMGFHRVGHS